MRDGLALLFTVSTVSWVLLGILSRCPAVQSLDEQLLGSLCSGSSSGPAGKRARKIETAMRDLTAIGGDTVLGLIFLIGTVMLVTQGHVERAGQFAAVLIAARGSGFLLKAIIERPRPGAAGGSVATFTSSFPSVHTLMSFVSTFALLFVSGANIHLALSFAAFVSFVVGSTRLYFVVHWPSDVVAGWCGGMSLCTWVVLATTPG
ncbi:phosphatase PAP2 family protein [Parasphingopyxis algicola]|uniref:phosphatase PAP2 family protein n=1 Tax=Parasphingopyxis algicola TaxID=2026624 RepID=UPI0015A4BAE0|nr:phosphatase PAP2 family protein [Parasphingopyxis algicola]QLC24406.1 phosphatase PAP2 family protein [Parasphingopyxis algicola]